MPMQTQLPSQEDTRIDFTPAPNWLDDGISLAEVGVDPDETRTIELEKKKQAEDEEKRRREQENDQKST